jgi:hypothetical protein
VTFIIRINKRIVYTFFLRLHAFPATVVVGILSRPHAVRVAVRPIADRRAGDARVDPVNARVRAAPQEWYVERLMRTQDNTVRAADTNRDRLLLNSFRTILGLEKVTVR